MAEAISNNYVVGKGKVYFERFAPGTKTGDGERYMGNTPEFMLNNAKTTLDHYSAEGGIATKDDAVDVQVNRSAKLQADNISPENLALFFNGDSAPTTIVAATGLTDAPRALKKGMWFQIGVSGDAPSGLRNITNFVLKTTAMTPVVVDATGNYEVDLVLARVYIEIDAPDIVNGTEYKFYYDTEDSVRDVIVSKNQSVYGALRFISDNPTGLNKDYYLPYVKVTAESDFALKGDKWQDMGLAIDILKLNDTTESVYIDGRPA